MKKALNEASSLAEELRQEQNQSVQMDRAGRSLEGRMKEMQARLDEAEAAAMQGGRKVIQKMEQRIHELELELENEQHQHNETTKSMRRQDRRLKELAAQVDEDKSTHEKLHEIIEKMHQKLKNYKRHIDEMVRRWCGGIVWSDGEDGMMKWCVDGWCCQMVRMGWWNGEDDVVK